MKYFFIFILSFCASLAFAQQMTLPLSGDDFYKTIDVYRDYGRKTGRIKAAENLVRETFMERYAPKSIKTDADIISRVQKYKINPNIRHQDIGWFFETVVKNKHQNFDYVKKSNAHNNDLTGKLSDRRFINAQLKVHYKGDPKIYFKDLKRYKAMLIIPDDHVVPLKKYIQELIRQRSYLEKLTNPNPSQQRKLKKLKDLGLERKKQRIMGGGITYKELSEKYDKGIRILLQQFKTMHLKNIIYSIKTSHMPLNIGDKAIGSFLKSISISSSVKYFWMAGGFLYTGYEYYDSFNKLSNNELSLREFKKNLSSSASGASGALLGLYISTALIGSDAGISAIVGSIAGGIVGYLMAEQGFNYYYTKLDKESQTRIEHFANEFYGYKE